MSETQKWVTSISGAIVGQVFVLLFFMLLVNRPHVTEFSDKLSKAPQEVTIMLSELIPEPEPLVEPEPEPEKEPEREKRFINTDTNTAVDEAPKNAAYESDRNTIASTQIKPDETLPQEEGPTTVGREDAPSFELRDQELQDGDIQHSATPPPSIATLAAQPVEPEPPSEVEQEQPELEQQADKLTEADTNNRSDKPTPESSQEELLKIGNGPKPNEIAKVEEKEVSNRDAPKEIAPPASPTKNELIERELEEYRRQLTMGAFSPAFQAQTRQSNNNGDIQNIGEGSVNAESTAVGAYKKSVSSAIAQKWHAYRRTTGIATPGYMRVSFSVNSKGQVHNLTVRTNEADTTLAEFSLKAIREADIPPMPTQVINDLGPGGLTMNYDISIY